MTFQSDPGAIRWRLHLAASPDSVYRMISTDDGRALFWAESAVETDGEIEFRFPGGETWTGEILERVPSSRFRLVYFGSTTTFELAPDGSGGTELLLVDEGVSAGERDEVIAGWVSVLLAAARAAIGECDGALEAVRGAE